HPALPAPAHQFRFGAPPIVLLSEEYLMSHPQSLSAPANEVDLEDRLSTPLEGVGEVLAAVDGDILLLGAGGKIGPSMATMARRALDSVRSDARVIAASRFSDVETRARLGSAGITTISADLSRPEAYDDLPDAAAMFYLAAMKFGTTDQEHHTWWSNAALPTMVPSRHRGRPSVIYRPRNIHPLAPLSYGGSVEDDSPGPLGEYAQSSLARERIFTAAAHTWQTPMPFFRLNHACEMRYGVIADIAA